RPPLSSLFPYTTLFRSAIIRILENHAAVGMAQRQAIQHGGRHAQKIDSPRRPREDEAQAGNGGDVRRHAGQPGSDASIQDWLDGDRKSTRLNSSHVKIS